MGVSVSQNKGPMKPRSIAGDVMYTVQSLVAPCNQMEEVMKELDKNTIIAVADAIYRAERTHLSNVSGYDHERPVPWDEQTEFQQGTYITMAHGALKALGYDIAGIWPYGSEGERRYNHDAAQLVD